MLGFLRKRVLGAGHPALAEAFLFVSDLRGRYHDESLVSHLDSVNAFRTLYDNSIWSYILIYNRLPQNLINTEIVSTLQSKLTQLARMRAKNCDVHSRESWHGDIGRFSTRTTVDLASLHLGILVYDVIALTLTRGATRCIASLRLLAGLAPIVCALVWDSHACLVALCCRSAVFSSGPGHACDC